MSKKNDLRQKQHGLSKHPLYSVHRAMMHRCYNEKCESYPNYGGRGIKICSEWANTDNYSGLKAFIKWGVQNGYEKGLSIERVDVNGDYSPENCTFITMKEQQANKRSTCHITINGTTKHLSEWSRISGLSTPVIWQRVKLGWDEDSLLGAPIEKMADKQSGIVGITWNTTRKRWKVEIRYNNSQEFLGWYKDLDEAKKIHREFCNDKGLKVKHRKVS